jgi:hypothetical protein
MLPPRISQQLEVVPRSCRHLHASLPQTSIPLRLGATHRYLPITCHPNIPVRPTSQVHLTIERQTRLRRRDPTGHSTTSSTTSDLKWSRYPPALPAILWLHSRGTPRTTFLKKSSPRSTTSCCTLYWSVFSAPILGSTTCSPSDGLDAFCTFFEYFVREGEYPVKNILDIILFLEEDIDNE